jgi:hypothetical protein
MTVPFPQRHQPTSFVNGLRQLEAVSVIVIIADNLLMQSGHLWTDKNFGRKFGLSTDRLVGVFANLPTITGQWIYAVRQGSLTNIAHGIAILLHNVSVIGINFFTEEAANRLEGKRETKRRRWKIIGQTTWRQMEVFSANSNNFDGFIQHEAKHQRFFAHSFQTIQGSLAGRRGVRNVRSIDAASIRIRT